MNVKTKSCGGSGRGHKGKIVNDEMERPDCERCGGWMRSHGDGWHCTECGARILKIKHDEGIKAYNDSKGYDTEKTEAHARKCEKKKTLIITSAQNNSETFIKGLKSLKQAAEYYNAELAIIPSHYRNVSLYQKGDKKEFCPLIKPYLVSSTIEFGNVEIHTDIRINPTAVNPLSAMESIGGAHDIVIGHPQQMRTPVAAHGYPKRMFTTGSITLPNYAISKVGVKGEFNHSMSAIVLEKEGDFVFIRQLTFDDKGHCYDLDIRFTPSSVTKNHNIEVLTTGDEHIKYNSIEKETYGKGGMTERLKPKYVVRHDTLDGYAGSHHHNKSPMTKYKKFVKGDNDYEAELNQVVDFINRTTPKGAKTLIVDSNHHNHLLQFLETANPNTDHKNSKFILKMNADMRVAVDLNLPYDPFYLYLKDRLTCDFEFLDRNEAYLINNIDYSNHGDLGISGSRGSAKGLSKISTKTVIGHSHTAMIYHGCFQVGVSTDRMEYAKGLSSWSNTHCVQYKNGKRALIDIYNGRYCARRRLK